MSYATWEPLPVNTSVLEGCIELIRPNLLLDGVRVYYNVHTDTIYQCNFTKTRINVVEVPSIRQELLDYNKERIEKTKELKNKFYLFK